MSRQASEGTLYRWLTGSTSRAAGLALCFLVTPVCLLGSALGRHRAPGLPVDDLYAFLWSSGQLRRWLAGVAVPGRADLAKDAAAFWPARPVPTLLQAVAGWQLDEGLAFGLLLLALLFLAGLGPALLAQRLLGSGRVWAVLLSGLAVQLSPPVILAAWSADLAVLGVGPLALALAVRRPWAVALFSLIAGGFGAALGLGIAFVGIVSRRPWALFALVPVVVGLALPSASLPGSPRVTARPPGVPAYVTAVRAVFPLPEAGASERPDWGLTDPRPSSAGQLGRIPARLHGGPLALLGCLLALFFRPSRAWGGVGVVVLAALTAGLGLLPLPGVPPPAAAAWFDSLFEALGADSAEFLAMLLLCAGLGWAALARWRWPAAVACGLLLWLGTPLHPLQPGLPVTNLPPEPAVQALENHEPGPFLAFPDPAPPFTQDGPSVAEVLHLASRLGRPIHVGHGPHPDPALVAHLAWVVDHPIDQAAAEIVWETRAQAPLEAARGSGTRAVLVDSAALQPDQLDRLRGELQRLLGPPLAEGGRWLAWGI